MSMTTTMQLHPQQIEALSKIFLMRLDPSLRALLTVVQHYQKEHCSCSSQQQLQLLQRQSELLQRLDEELVALSNMVRKSQSQLHADDVFARALEPLMEYVTLPLLAIIKGTPLDWNIESSSTTSDRIRQSSAWRVVQLAAQVYKTHLLLATTSTTTTTTSQQQQQATKTLTACAFALPSGQQVEEQGNGAAAIELATTTRLDRGTDCLLALLRLVQHAASSTTRNNSQSAATVFAKQVAQCMNGALVARIVDTCITLVKIHDTRQSTALVVAANATIQALQTAVPIETIWRGAFPGCFGGLYSSLLQQLRATSIQSNLAAAMVQTLALLLQRTLGTTESTKKNKTTKTDSNTQAMSRLQANLQSFSVTANTVIGDAPDSHRKRGDKTATAYPASVPNETDEQAFYRQVRTRIASPMIVLFRQLAAARAVGVRREAVSLYGVLLLTTDSSCWSSTTAVSSSSTSNVIKAALESCMILTNDADTAVMAAARKVVEKYGSQTPNAAPIDTIVALMEELPALAQSQRQSEMRMQLKLLSAYLDMNMSSKSLYARMCVDGSAEWLRNRFASLCDVDFESFDSTMGSSAVLVTSTDVVYRPKDPVSRYLDDDTRTAASQCIRVLGQALGSKYAALMIDACMADIYESASHRVDRQAPLTGTSQVAWLHDWIGSMELAKYLLDGAFHSDVLDCDTDKQRRKQSRILEELEQSILPVITSSALFDLPSSKRMLGDGSRDDDEAAPRAIMSALRGNAAFIFVLLDLIGTLFAKLGPQGTRFLPTTLFAILEKASWMSSPSVQDMAGYVLERIAHGCDFDSRPMLILANVDTLMGSMNARLRVPGGSMIASSFRLDRNVVLVSVASVALLGLLCSATQDDAHSLPSGKCVLSQVQQLFANLAIRFDHQAVHLSHRHVESMVFLELFDAVLCFLVYLNGNHNIAETTDDVDEEALAYNWKKVLEPFEKDVKEGMSPAEGFALHRTTLSKSLPQEPNGVDRSLLPGQMLLVNDILTRSTYLLSHTSLSIQIASCRVTTRGFQFLGWIAAQLPEKNDESNGPTTAILRQVHSHWPSISARLKATTAALTMTGSPPSSLLVPSSLSTFTANHQQQHSGELRVYLSQLFVLAGIMCDCAGDFMCRHYREVVWPCLGKVFGMFLPSSQPKSGPETRYLTTAAIRREAVSLPGQARRHYSESELGLILGMMRCVTHVYSNRPMGLSVAQFITSTGTMILPFLEHDKLFEAGMNAMKRMLRIDSDSLYRHLMNVSGRAIPSLPWRVSGDKCAEQKENDGNSKLLLAARLLLEFSDSLPEQSFDGCG